MKIKQFEFSMFGVNTYVLWDPDTKEAAIVDPAMTDEAECRRLDDFIASEGLKVIHLINTHLHLDHTFGNEHVEKRYGVNVEAHPAEADLGASRQSQADMFHLPMRLGPVRIGKELRDGDVVKIGHDSLTVLDVPGHSPGGIALYDAADGFVLTGDALFRRSIGRTDLPGGNHGQLVDSINSKLLTLPPSTAVLPGHGPYTTIADELRSNPFL